MDEDKLTRIANGMQIVISCEGESGMNAADLARRSPSYRKLPPDERFRVAVLLMKRTGIAVMLEPEGPRFYRRSMAPIGAFSIGDYPSAGETIMRALRRT